MRAPASRTALRQSRRPRRSGSAAVEFALVGLPFLFLLFAIMQLGLLFVVESVLENATLESARLIRTGQAKQSNLSPAQFKTELCSRMSVFSGDCMSRAEIDIRELPQFTNPSPPNPVSNGTFNQASLAYTNANASSLVLVRVWYRQPLIAPTMFQALSRLSSGETLLTASTAFRSEPHPF